MVRIFKISILFFLLIPFISFAQPNKDDSAFIRDNYTKRELYITMRDGVRLFTSVYEPKDNTEQAPILQFAQTIRYVRQRNHHPAGIPRPAVDGRRATGVGHGSALVDLPQAIN